MPSQDNEPTTPSNTAPVSETLPDGFEPLFEMIREIPTNRVDLSELTLTNKCHWAHAVAKKIINEFPDQDVYTCAAGISPSGVVHFGNFRDVMTTLLVIKQLEQLGKETRFIFSWDDFDRFRKVPNGVDKSFEKYLGLPLCNVPDPEGKLESYAKRFELPFEKTMKDLGINLEYRYQGEEYQSGRYNQAIIETLQRREEVSDILLAHMSRKGMLSKGIDPATYKETSYPISVYSRFTGKDDTTVLGFDGSSEILYRCNETGKVDTVDLLNKEDSRVKLSWKIDWPMRWRHEGVVFEPGGADHASPNGSYDVSARVSKKIFGYSGPLFVGYAFIGLQELTGKMSGSKGGALSPGDLLEVYEPEILKWLYARKSPDQEFYLAFDMDVFRLYDEFDQLIAQSRRGELPAHHQTTIDVSTSPEYLSRGTAIKFRQAAGLGQAVNWNLEKAIEAEQAIGHTWGVDSLQSRLERAKNWLERYNPEAMITIRDSLNSEYAATMKEEAKNKVRRLCTAMRAGGLSLRALDDLVYAIPKSGSASPEQNRGLQRAFFIDVYQLVVGRDTGPRLSTLLGSIDQERVIQLLSV